MPLLLRSLSILIFLAAVLFGTPGLTSAQQILAAIIPADLPRYHQAHEAMTEILRTGGFTEDKLKIFVQKPNTDKMSLTNSLRRCQAAGATMVITYGSQATQIASQELNDIPLLFADVYDPVAMGVVKSMAAPGTNATGVSSKTDLSLLISSLSKMKPLKNVGIVYTKGESGSELQLAELKAQASTLGFSIVDQSARNPNEALKQAEKLAGSCDALYLSESLAVAQKANAIVTAVQTKKIPVFSQIPGLVEHGAFIGLEADPAEQGKLLGVHALQILLGQKAFVLPVRPAKNIDLKINQTTAKALAVKIPADIQAGTKVVQ